MKVMRAPKGDAKRMVGQVRGSLKVLGLVGRKWTPSGACWLLWIVDCQECGAQTVISTNSLQRPHRYCRACSQATLGYVCSVKIDDMPLTELAESHGLKPNTVYQRYIRGWDKKDLLRKPYRPGEGRNK